MLQPTNVMRGLVGLGFVVGALSLVHAAPGGQNPAASAPEPRALAGWGVYERFCLACHGARGDGQGPPAPFTWGRPRAFTRGEYEWRSTPIGQPPTDEDLRTTIRYGARGTSMPNVTDALTVMQIDQL